MDSSHLRPPLTSSAAGDQTSTPPLSPIHVDVRTQHPPISLLRSSLREPSPPHPNPAGQRAIPHRSPLVTKLSGEGYLGVGAVLGLRVLGLVLSLISFSVMAANRTVGWGGDSFDRYIEYRYLVVVNVTAFAYSGFQAYSHLHHMITNRYLIRDLPRHYFDFSMDQVLAYLLMSVSSSAASCNNSWILMFGSDEFTIMANASIAMSFLAFISLALSSLVSAYYLFRQTI